MTQSALARRQTLQACAAELRALSDACERVEQVLGALLQRTGHPGSAALHGLQDLDRIRQTLADLAPLVAGLDAATTLDQIDQLIADRRLGDLGDRLRSRQRSDPTLGPPRPDVHLF